MILTSFHSADPSTPTGVRCGKCLWVIHRPAIWAYESTCLLENLCAFLDVYLALACLCELLQLHIWLTYFAMMILTSFHSADPSTPTGVRCGKCLWVIQLYTVLLSEHMNPHVCWRICVRSWMFILRLHVFVNGCNCTFDSLILPWWSLQVSIRQTLVLPRVYVVENACELYTVLLSEHMNPHVCWIICVRSWTLRLRFHVFVNGWKWTFDSFFCYDDPVILVYKFLYGRPLVS